MYINANITKAKYKFCECFDDYTDDVSAMFDLCEELDEKSSYDVDELVSQLEDVGNTRRKQWEISCANSFADSRDCYLEFMITFNNGFYICLQPSYLIEGRC